METDTPVIRNDFASKGGERQLLIEDSHALDDGSRTTLQVVPDNPNVGAVACIIIEDGYAMTCISLDFEATEAIVHALTTLLAERVEEGRRPSAPGTRWFEYDEEHVEEGWLPYAPDEDFVGARCRIVNPDSAYTGEEGVIALDDNSENLPLHIEFRHIGENWFDYDEVEVWVAL